MGSDDVEVTRKETPFEGYFHIDRYHLRHRQFAGGMGPEISREIFERGHAACCLLYDPDLDLLVMVEQFRVGAFAARQSPWFDDDASPWLIEEISHYLVTPGGSTESMFAFCGRVDASNAGGIHGLDEEGEDIRVFTATPEEAFAMLADGKIRNSMTMLPLFWFKENRDRLRALWRRTDP
jgi:ADP-ribose pyrophosphatase